MNKLQWAEHYGFDDEDMAQITLTLSYGVKITAVFDTPLDYEIIKLKSY